MPRTIDTEKLSKAQEVVATYASEEMPVILEALQTMLALPSKAMAYYWFYKAKPVNRLETKAKESYQAKRAPIEEKDLTGFFPNIEKEWYAEVYGGRKIR